MSLKGQKPSEVKEGKPKLILSGKFGCGKTTFALNFPKPYLIDTEGGAVRKQYVDILKKSNGAYFGKEHGSQDFDAVVDEVKLLATTKHDYKSLIIDSYSYLYLLKAAEAEEIVGNTFGRDKKEANRPTRQLMRWIEKIDMNVIIICHQKDKWTRKNGDPVCEGTTYDGYEKLEGILDLWIEIDSVGNNRTYVVKKTRIEAFQEGARFKLDFNDFSKKYGEEIINKEVEQVKLSTKEQIEQINKLLEIVKVDDTWKEKIFKKIDVDGWEDMPEEKILKCIEQLNEKIKKQIEQGDKI